MSRLVPSYYGCRTEEVLPLARLVRKQVEEDLGEFAELLPEEYGADFLPDFDARLAAAKGATSNRTAQGESTALGDKLATTMKELPRLLNRLEARLRRAQGLTVAARAFGLKEVRAAREAEDVEELEEALGTLLQNVDANAAALAAKGHAAADTAALRGMATALATDLTEQDLTQMRQQRLTQEGVRLYNHLWALVREVLADGKSQYRGVDRAKERSYTLTQLLKRVRQEQSETGGTKP
ncbi:hypothetical protein [Hymenobacter sp. B81]|uniref:hypothetical protein n=1 Tax=Hymenobacter sp. B81 TaxID=3344878 RepID=UPI0037DC1C40